MRITDPKFKILGCVPATCGRGHVWVAWVVVLFVHVEGIPAATIGVIGRHP